MTPKKRDSIPSELALDPQQLSKALETKQAELDLLKGIQDGLAAGLDIDSIFEQAGERIVQLFPGKGVALYTYDPVEQMGDAKFILEDGVRHYPPPFKSGPIAKKAAATKKPLVISTRAEFDEMGAITVPGTSPSLSGMYTPLIVNGVPVGALNIESTIEEHAFNDSDLELVSTIAASLSVALENARLFDELQKRNIELSEALEHKSATSEILHVMASSQSEIQPVFDAVAENAAKLCEADDVQIYRVEGDRLLQVAHIGPLPALQDGESLPLLPGLITGRAVIEQRTIHTPDSEQISPSEYPESYKLQKRLKHRSVIATPLVREGSAMGAIVVRRNHVQPFTDDQIALLKTFADQAAIAIENVRLFNETTRLLKETEERNAELAIINTVQRALSAQLDIRSIYKAVGEQLRQIFDTQTIAIYSADLERRINTSEYAFEKGQEFEPVSHAFTSLHDHLTELNETYLFNGDFPEFAAQFPDYTPSQGELPIALVGVPIRWKDDPDHVVTLTLQDIDGGKTFTDSDVRLLETLAGSMSVALQNARLLKLTEQRAEELSIINGVQTALADKLDIQAIYDAIGGKLHEVFPEAQVVDILSYNAEKQLFLPRYVLERDERYEIEPWIVSGFRKHVVESGSTMVLNRDVGQTAAEYDNTWLGGGEPAKSWIGVPLKHGRSVTGVISLQHLDKEDAFSESDVRLIETLAGSMGVALENARLFDETQRLLKVTEERNAELAVITSVQQGLASKLDMQSIYELVGETIRKTFDAQVVVLRGYDLQLEMEIEHYVFEKGERTEIPPYPLTPLGKMLVREKQVIVINSDFRRRVNELTGEDPVLPAGDMPLSAIFVPLFRGEDVVGSISLQNVDHEDAFAESDVRLLRTLANAMSISLDNARLFDETQRLLAETEQRAAELQIINSVQEALASKLEMQAIYELVGEKIREIFKADTTFIAFHDPDKKNILAPYYADKGVTNLMTTRPYGKGLAEEIIESGGPLHMNTAEEMDAFGAYHIASPGSSQDLNQSFLGVPIFRNGVPIGAASVQSYQPYAFDSNDLKLLQTLANSMSVALENARLFDETERLLVETEQRAAELASINTVSQALVAELDLEVLIDLIGEQIRQTFDADIVYVALLDSETDIINFPYTHGEELIPLPRGEGLTGKIIETGQPLLINSEMDKRRAELGITLIGKRAQSFLGVPIRIGGQSLGVISVQSTSQEGRFNEGDLRLLNTIAANVGAAIRNAQLFEEIKRQKQYYEAVIENSPAAIVLLDMQANITGWNPAAERLFGYSEGEALGRNVDDLVARSEELHDEAVRYSDKALQEKQVHVLARRTRKDGSLVDVDISGLPVSVDGRYVGFIAIYHDVTEMQRAREVAEQASQAKSAFLANMSHELRTPLNAIIGFTRIVRRKGADLLPEKQLENLDKVLVSAEHLLSLINSVLDISKIESGRIDVKPSIFELSPLVDQILGTSQPLLREGVSLKADIMPDIPVLHTDQEKVRQILINLLSNAAKFTHQGEIVLGAWKDGGTLRVDVNDTGIGIPHDSVERVFEEFQQADSSTTREYGGTGLGLSISRSLARLLGGDLTACSIQGEGSTFSLSIPIQFNETPAAEPQPPVREEVVDTLSGEPVILSIDDDDYVHDLLQENLGERGYQVVSACTAEEGLRLAHELKPFAITLDLMMPGKDGWQVLHELKSDPDTRKIPVILLTIVDKQALGYQLGADEYLVKPLEEGALQAALQRINADRQSDSEKRMLVVDDDPDIPDLIRQLLESAHYKIEAAPDGEAALAAIESQPPDVILLDLMMPLMDGFDFLEALRGAGRKIPVIVLTAKTLSTAELELLEGRVERIIKKNGLEQERLLGELQQTMAALQNRQAGAGDNVVQEQGS